MKKTITSQKHCRVAKAKDSFREFEMNPGIKMAWTSIFHRTWPYGKHISLLALIVNLGIIVCQTGMSPLKEVQIKHIKFKSRINAGNVIRRKVVYQ